MTVNLDMDAAVRLVERKQAERERIAADLQDRAILADIAVAQYKRQIAERARETVHTALTFVGTCGVVAVLWILVELIAKGA